LTVRDAGLIEVSWVVDLVQTHAEMMTRWGLYVLLVVTAFPVTMNVSTHSFGEGPQAVRQKKLL
jgi:hypothetical protein